MKTAVERIYITAAPSHNTTLSQDFDENASRSSIESRFEFRRRIMDRVALKNGALSLGTADRVFTDPKTCSL